MSDKETKEEFLKKLKSMSLEELRQYESVVNVLNGGINFFGVMTILLMLSFPVMSVLFAGALALYFLASTGSNASRFRAEIRKLIEAKDK
jgi:hypothetical protein